MDKLFTVNEANTLLPVLESLLKRAMEGKQTMQAIDKEMESLKHRIFLTGGMRVDVIAVSRRKDDREKAIQRIKDAVAEIHATGVQVKDLDVGLLDFPHVVHVELGARIVRAICARWRRKKSRHPTSIGVQYRLWRSRC